MQIKNMNLRTSGVTTFELFFEGDEWENSLNKVSRKLQQENPVQGYRTGKAPLDIVYKTFGSVLIDEAAKPLIGRALQQVYNEYGLQPVSEPYVSYIETSNTRLHCMCSLINYPEVNDFEYVGITAEKPVRFCTEEDIDNSIADYMTKHLYVHEVDRPAEMGDIVEVDFTGTHEGAPFEFDHSPQNRFTMGSGTLFAGLDETLVGHSAGDHLSLSLTMPDDFHRENIRGMTLDLEVNLHGVWARDKVEYCTDQYVKECVGGCETVEDFREKQRKTIQKQYDNKSQEAFEQSINKALADQITIQVPQSMIDVAIEKIVNMMARAAAQEGITESESEEDHKKRIEGYRETARPIAEQQVKTSMALDYVIRHENIVATQDDIDGNVKIFAASLNIPEDEALRRLGGTEALAEKIQNTKALSFVCDHANVIETRF